LTTSPSLGAASRDSAHRASIVIVNYNGAEFIETSIRTAAAQPGCDVIVVDNASTDDSLRVLRAIPGIRLIANDCNPGFGGGANLGAAAASGEFVAFLNSDALADARWIATIAPWMDANGFDLASSVVTSFGKVWFAGGRWIPALGAALTSHRPMPECDWVSGCALVARRTAWERLGGFDERYFMYFEDVDLCLRARAAGFRVGVHPGALVTHDVPGRSAAALGFRKLRIGYRSKGRLAARFVPRALLPFACAFQCSVSPLGQGVPPKRLPEIWQEFFSGLRS
jgi:GT2 family glycosyltransferase